MKQSAFIVQIAVGAVVYVAILAMVHAVSGSPVNWLINLTGLAAFVIAGVAARAIVSL